MTPNEKFRLEQRLKNRQWLLRFRRGLREIKNDRQKLTLVIAYVIVALLLWFFREPVFRLDAPDIFTILKKGMLGLVLPVFGVAGLFFLIAFFGTPSGSRDASENLMRTGFINHTGETPMMIAKRPDNVRQDVTVMEFEAGGIPKSRWEDERQKLETALNVHIVKISEGVDKQHVYLHTVPAGRNLPKTIRWQNSYLSGKSFELVLGESLLGRMVVNLAQIPHVLLGGSTGSGKSVLLKLLVMQCVKKGATVYIADFKGGVDFPAAWHERCKIITDENSLLELLTNVVDELERRKILFRAYDCAHIDAYCFTSGIRLNRIIFACDEVAEILDKNGLSKNDKGLVSKIESKLSVIARQGRAFGIHLILATQRPDATILSGQIRNNIDYRVCGRADHVLSQIILDNTTAADQIAKDAQGCFITHEGLVFQGYLFDENRDL